jgi:hypothetical protein
MPWTGILVGNGASLAVWQRFAYSSLFAVAQSKDVEVRLGPNELAAFDAVRTRNFETVLNSLRTTAVLNVALGVQDDGSPEQAYDAIRLALIDAVRWVHPPRLGDGIRKTVREELRRYNWVYSTNYDLIIYWSMMFDPEAEGFVDFFWRADGVFDPSDTDVWESRANWTHVLYLHGAIHLERDAWGATRKRHATDGTSLLASFQAEPIGLEGWMPQFVSEGSSREKRQAISRSEYLSFVHEAFEWHDGPLVVFGHSLSEEDTHLVHAINTRTDAALAVGVYPPPGDPETAIEAEKGRVGGLFPSRELHFFDARSHPLGSESLRFDEAT